MHKGLIVTLTEAGITLKLKRHRTGLSITWDNVIAAAAAEQVGQEEAVAHGLKKLGVKETP